MRIELCRESLVVRLEGWDKLWAAVRSDIAVDLHTICGVRARPPEAAAACKGLRVGTDLPGWFTAGTRGGGEGRPCRNGRTRRGWRGSQYSAAGDPRLSSRPFSPPHPPGTFYHPCSGAAPDFYFVLQQSHALALDLAPPARYGRLILDAGPGADVDAVAAEIAEAVAALGDGGQAGGSATACGAAVLGGGGKAGGTAAGGGCSGELEQPLL
eukprot:scaffold8.g1716.t1